MRLSEVWESIFLETSLREIEDAFEMALKLLIIVDLRERGGAGTNLMQYSDNALQAILRYVELERILGQGGGLSRFLTSPQFESVSYVSIVTRLRAADIVYFPERDPEPSLIDDFSIAGTALPYSDMFATENYMAALIK